MAEIENTDEVNNTCSISYRKKLLTITKKMLKSVIGFSVILMCAQGVSALSTGDHGVININNIDMYNNTHVNNAIVTSSDQTPLNRVKRVSLKTGDKKAVARCPDTVLERAVLAKFKCTHNQYPNYMCLYDSYNMNYASTCANKVLIARAGDKNEFSPGVNTVKCDESRMQIKKFYAPQMSECELLRSQCNEEGQVLDDSDVQIDTDHNNPELVYKKMDRRCYCDSTKGYAFVDQPDNKCHCYPLLEDCSCYKKDCAEGEVLTPYYECISKTTYDEQRQEFEIYGVTSNKHECMSRSLKEVEEVEEVEVKDYTTDASISVENELDSSDTIIVASSAGAVAVCFVGLLATGIFMGYIVKEAEISAFINNQRNHMAWLLDPW